ncbi:hypothetical protein C8R44DRAFT_726086 [Mycena epipterygia]|nr:hypothetical protein C8R44DRAFT_726086 [Mycena epipterygia]
MTSSRNTTFIFLVAVVSLTSDPIASAILDVGILATVWLNELLRQMSHAAVWHNFAQTASNNSDTCHTSLLKHLSNAFSSPPRKPTRPKLVRLVDYAIQNFAPCTAIMLYQYTPSSKDRMVLDNQYAPKYTATPVIIVLHVGISSTHPVRRLTVNTPVATDKNHLNLLAKPPATHLPMIPSTAYPAPPISIPHGPDILPAEISIASTNDCPGRPPLEGHT